MSSFYPVASSLALPGVAAGRVGAGMFAVRLEDLVAGRPRTAGRRGGGSAPARERGSLLTLAADARPAGPGDRVVVMRPVLVGTVRGYDDGTLAIEGQASEFVSLGPLEAEFDRRFGPGALDRLIGEAFARVDSTEVGDRTAGEVTGQDGSPTVTGAGPAEPAVGQDNGLVFTRRVIVRTLLLGMLTAGTSWDDVLATLFAPVADVPFTGHSETPTGSGFSRARRTVPGAVVAAVCERFLAFVRDELAGLDDPQALTAGQFRMSGFDGSLIRLPDTDENRAFYGAGTDPAPYPHVRLFVDDDAGTKAPLAYAHGPSSGEKADSEQAQLEEIATTAPAINRGDRAHVGDRNYPGGDRLARLHAAGMKLVIRLRDGITVTRDGDRLPDDSFLATIGTDPPLTGWRVIEYDVFADGVHTGETFAVATNITDPAALPADEVPAAYRSRWGATETPFRETKAMIKDSGPGAGPMLRATDPFEVDQEIPALILATSLIRAAQRTVAAQAVPAEHGARAGQPVLVRELSTKATVLAVLRHLDATTPGLPDEISATRLGRVHAALGRRRHTPDRPRTRDRRSQSPSDFPKAGPGTTTRKVTYTARICGRSPATIPTGPATTTPPDVTDRDRTAGPAKAA